MRKWSIKRSLQFLVNRLPVGGTVTVSVCKMGALSGDCTEITGGFRIRINKDDPLSAQQECLRHEYAHCLAGWSNTHMHHNEWGKAYAKIYRLMQDEV